MKTYSVKKLFQGRAELEVARFTTEDEATQYTQEALAQDAAMKVNAIYRVYHFDEDLISEWDQAKWQKEAPQNSSDSSSSSSKGSGQRFSPSPLNTAPRPPGTPHSSWKSDEEEDK